VRKSRRVAVQDTLLGVHCYVFAGAPMGNQNRKASKGEMDRIRGIIREAFPDLSPVFGGHGTYGGHRAPRDHTISFRLQDERGQFRSNVIWLQPDQLRELTAANIRALVARSNGRRR
jgi:hypothetical protein